MDAPGYNAGRRRVTADPPIAPGRACYKPRRVRAGSSPLVIAHMAVESARLVPGMKSLQLCQLQASENGPDTTERAPLDARGWVPSVFRARPAIKMQECLCLCPGSDWPPAPARFNPPRSGLRAASVCNHFVAAQVEETEPRRRRPVTRPPRLDGRRGRVAGGGNARRRPKKALSALRPLIAHVAPPGPRQAAQSHYSTRGTRRSRSDVQRVRRGSARTRFAKRKPVT